MRPADHLFAQEKCCVRACVRACGTVVDGWRAVPAAVPRHDVSQADRSTVDGGRGCRYDEDAALTFGRAISGMLAQSKGRSLGIFQTKDQVQAAAPSVAVLGLPAAARPW